MPVSAIETISRRGRQLLNEISAATGITTDTKLYDEYASTSADVARGYLAGFAAHAKTQDVLLLYFLQRMLTGSKCS